MKRQPETDEQGYLVVQPGSSRTNVEGVKYLQHYLAWFRYLDITVYETNTDLHRTTFPF